MRIFSALLVAIFATAFSAPASVAFYDDELPKLLIALQNAPKLSGSYYNGRKHIIASFNVGPVEYHVEFERIWTLRKAPPESLRPVRGPVLVIQRQESGPRTFKNETYIDYDANGIVDYVSALHQPPFDRKPPKDYVYASRRANCIMLVIRCRTTGPGWQKVAEEQYKAVVREMITLLENTE
jgi:hypothetical protein